LQTPLKTAITSGSPNDYGEDNKYATLIFITYYERKGYTPIPHFASGIRSKKIQRKLKRRKVN